MSDDAYYELLAWPAHGGEMGARIRAFEWERTPLGPISSWPQSLKTTIGLMMASQLAMNLIWGPERILIYNDVHRTFMGKKHPRALGRPGREVWGEVWEAAEAIHQRVFAGEAVTLEDHPWVLLRNGGPEEAFFTSYFTPIRDETGAVVANLATAFETTKAVKEKAERDRAEQALRNSEARLREVLEGIGDAFYALDQDQRFVYASRKALETWGKTPDEVIGRRFLETFPHAAGTPGYEKHLRVLETGEAQHLELVSPLLGRWFEVDIYPSSTGISVAFRDIERRKQAEAALLASEARLKAAVELVGLSPYSGDPRTGALDWDARLKAMWGLPAGAHVDAPKAVAAIHPDDQARVAAAWEASLDPAGDGVFVAEYRVLGIEDGVERWVSTQLQNFFEHREPVRFIGAIREITQQKRAEAQLRESEARLKVVIAELQHRTRNILAVVRSIAFQTRAASKSLDDFAVEFSARLGALSRVQGLLSRGDYIAVTLRELVYMEIGALGAQVDGARIVVDGSDVPLPNASVQLLALALHELATNALKYGVLDSSEGRLEVKWREEMYDGRQPHLVLEWIESGLDRRNESAAYRRGFGRELIERALPYQLDATTHYELTRDGVRCSIEIPLTANGGAGRQDADG